MAQPQLPDPVKLIVAALWGTQEVLRAATDMLMTHWGPLDFVGLDRPFDRTDYYEREMGPNLYRRLMAFAELVPPESLGAAKLICNAIEDETAVAGRRQANLDVGYLDHNKIVLASAKGAGQKIHLGGGIYADLIARYSQGRYCPFAWTFPDFKDGRYDDELAAIRHRYLQQLRARRAKSL